ncbi:MAG: hypothetical protein M1819_000164 [Sarea resinae]|nr:MAG: hypothetical protein M1819_000164 [Sarea resinae]
MLRMGSWLQSKPRIASSTQSLTSLEEPQSLEDAMRSVMHIMNDDVEAAEAGLMKGHSTFHKLGMGVVAFIKATLGFEREIMKEASDRLGEAEVASSNDERHAQRDPASNHSTIYAPGTVFALCHAESQLMNAVVAVMTESLTESIKGFYKLRKAYITLQRILDSEESYLKERSTVSIDSARTVSSASLQSSKSKQTVEPPMEPPAASSNDSLLPPYSSTDASVVNDAQSRKNESNGSGNNEIDDFYDADETHDGLRTPATYTGHIETNPVIEKLNDLSLQDQMAAQDFAESQSTSSRPPTETATLNGSSAQEEDAWGKLNPIEAFTHSGANFCFGMLLVMMSMIPPAFGKLLYIIGFKGDRERGLRMIWEASKYQNIHGALAALVILTFYNGLIGFADILPDGDQDELEGYPRERLEALLAEMRRQYPKSYLWLLEDARMEAANGNLEKGVELLSGETQSPLKQVEALAMFEKSLDAMYLHRYELCADSFLKCIELNSWSHALYYYIAGAAHVELYRRFMTSDPKLAQKHAAKAEELLHEVPKHTGKKRFMARQLPFDIFVYRKLQKWEARASEWKVPLVDAVGVSPIEEMIYLWNGFKRMRPTHLEDSLAALAWSSSPSNANWSREELDEHATLALLRAVTLRNLGRFDEARDVLQKEILCHDRAAFKGPLKEDWTCPTAHYEMAVAYWLERDGSRGEGDQEKVAKCAEWLDKAARWESYELDARIGMKIVTAQDTLRKYNASASAPRLSATA